LTRAAPEYCAPTAATPSLIALAETIVAAKPIGIAAPGIVSRLVTDCHATVIQVGYPILTLQIADAVEATRIPQGVDP